MPGCLPGNAQCDRNPVPAPPACARCRYPLGDEGLISPDLVGGFGDGPQVRQVVCRSGGGIQLVGEPLEAAGCLADLGICVLHASPLLEEWIELRVQPHGMDDHQILAS
jgi:hypothetical protein